MQYIIKDTSGKVWFGPIVKSTDGYSALTGIGTAAATGAITFCYGTSSTGDMTTAHSWEEVADGIYSLGYSTNLTRTVGSHLTISIGASSGIPIWEEAEILPADAYDAIHTTGTYFGAATGYTVDDDVTLGDLYKIQTAYTIGDSTYDGSTATYYDHAGTTFFKFTITTANRSRTT